MNTIKNSWHRDWLPSGAALVVAAAVPLLGAAAPAAALDMEVGLEYQWFPETAAPGIENYSSDQHAYLGLAWDRTFASDRWLFELDGYLAYDRRDHQRERADLRALALSYYGDNFDVKAGVMTEFWGVTESRHLVDILNQTSLADNIDEEVKLGQPMLKWQTHREWGNLQLFWLPVFRERLYPAAGSRLTPVLSIEEASSRYASGAERKHQDFAIRYTHSVGVWDLGLAHFSGTSREPLLDPMVDAMGQVTLSPYYEQIEQSSLDLQRTSDGLLLKLEAIYRQGNRQNDYHALVTGLEYTQSSVLGSAMDLGYLAEYLYDDRDDEATTPFANDLFLGVRLAANNVAQTSVLLGMYQDLENDGNALRLELSTRLRDNWVLELEGQTFSGFEPTDLLYGFRNDDYLRMTVKYYF